MQHYDRVIVNCTCFSFYVISGTLLSVTGNRIAQDSQVDGSQRLRLVRQFLFLMRLLGPSQSIWMYGFPTRKHHYTERALAKSKSWHFLAVMKTPTHSVSQLPQFSIIHSGVGKKLERGEQVKKKFCLLILLKMSEFSSLHEEIVAVCEGKNYHFAQHFLMKRRTLSDQRFQRH